MFFSTITIAFSVLRLHAGKSEENFYWRYGAFFKEKDINVFVRIDADQQKVFVHIEDKPGKFEVMKELFLFFALPVQKKKEADFQYFSESERDIRKSFLDPALSIQKSIDDVPDEIELSLNDIDFACVKDIKEAIELRAYKIKSKQGNFIEFNATIHQLLNTNTTMPKKIFLSYSHKDEIYKKELDTHFAALKRSGKVETWQDREILAGADWDKSIEEALFNADIALFLLSPDFMASDYIWNKEIPKAIEKGSKVIIVPIFIRPCDFKGGAFDASDTATIDLSKIQGLPRDAKWIVSSQWQYRDEAYLHVIEELKKLL